MCNVLKEIYRKVYNEPFVYENIENRIKLQKAVYLLENMGIYVGDYSFSWNKYGPYSLRLDIDAQKCSDREERAIEFSPLAEKCFDKVKGYTNIETSYTCVRWMECIASLLYLKQVYRYNTPKLLSELVKEKPMLNDDEANLKAINIIKEIKVGA